MRCNSKFLLVLISFFLINSLVIANLDFPFSPPVKSFSADLIHSVIIIDNDKITSTIDIFFGNFSDYNDDVLKLELAGKDASIFLDNQELESKKLLVFNITDLKNSRLHLSLTKPLIFESYLDYKTIFVDDLGFYSSNSLANPKLERFSIKFMLDDEFDFVENSYTSKHEDFLYYEKKDFSYQKVQISIKRKGIDDSNNEVDNFISSFNWIKFLKIFVLIILIPLVIFLLFKTIILFKFKQKNYDEVYDYIIKYERMGYSRQKLIDWLSSQGHSVEAIKKIIETHEKKKKDSRLLSKNKR
jgi:hypothetical protein